MGVLLHQFGRLLNLFTRQHPSRFSYQHSGHSMQISLAQQQGWQGPHRSVHRWFSLSSSDGDVDTANQELNEIFGVEQLSAQQASTRNVHGGKSRTRGAVWHDPADSASPARVQALETLHLTHVDAQGTASMVDVSEKPGTARVATASGLVHLGQKAYELVASNTQSSKGSVLSVAQIAGIMGAKQTSNLIPLCHPIPLSRIGVELQLLPGQHAVYISAEARTTGPTGVEMEALTAVSVAALTVYDMCKAVSHGIEIVNVRLESKSGGRSGTYLRERKNTSSSSHELSTEVTCGDTVRAADHRDK